MYYRAVALAHGHDPGAISAMPIGDLELLTAYSEGARQIAVPGDSES